MDARCARLQRGSRVRDVLLAMFVTTLMRRLVPILALACLAYLAAAPAFGRHIL